MSLRFVNLVMSAVASYNHRRRRRRRRQTGKWKVETGDLGICEFEWTRW